MTTAVKWVRNLTIHVFIFLVHIIVYIHITIKKAYCMLKNVHEVILYILLQPFLQYNCQIFFFLVEGDALLSGWSAVARSQLTPTSASWVQVVPLPQPP